MPPSAVTHISHGRLLGVHDSFSLEGEAFGGDRYPVSENVQQSMRDKASPLGEKLSSIGSSEPMDD